LVLKHISAQFGDAGIAAVYRLYEVFTERFGIDEAPSENKFWAQNSLTQSEVLLSACVFAQLSDIYTHRKKVGKALETTR
jgi:hypothetical protein